MKTKAAVLTGLHRDYEVREIDLAEPRAGEALVRMKVAGLCHSDEHNKCGGTSLPIVGGHEGAGVVEAVGPGVTALAVGDHVGVSWIPSCGKCRWCITGHSNLCDLGANLATGVLANGGLRFSMDGTEIGGVAATGTFSQWIVADERSLVKVDPDIPLEWVSLVTCGVTTGWGSVVNAGQVSAGDVVIIYGCGGIGSSAVQAAANAGAQIVATVDPVAMKREFAKDLGADRTYDNAADAHRDLLDLTRGVGADVAIVTVGKVTSEVVRAAFERDGRAEPAVAGATEGPVFVSVGCPIPGHEVRVVDDAGRERGVDRREHGVHARRRVEHHTLGPYLVRRRPGDGLFEQVRQRAVTEIVQQRGRERLARARGRDPLRLGQHAMDRP